MYRIASRALARLRSNGVNTLTRPHLTTVARSVAVRAFSIASRSGAASTTARFSTVLFQNTQAASPQSMYRRGFASLPEHTKLKMPALSPTMTQGNIASWTKKVGDKVKPGETMAEVETDKATVAFESVEEGYIAAILVPAGSKDVPVGSLVAILVEEQADVAAFKDYQGADGAAAPAAAPAAAAAPAPQAAAAQPAAQQAQQPAAAAPQAAQDGGRTFATPLARKIAGERGVDVSQIAGTGPNNRVIAADVKEFQPKQQAAPQTAAAPATPSGSFTDIPHTQVRRIIAKRLLESKQLIPHYYITVDITMDEVMRIRSILNASLDDKSKLSVNDFIVKASALALRKVPQVNSSWLDNAIRQYNYVDVSVAVATPTGLITPIVQDADIKGLAGISSDVKRLAAKAKENKLTPEEYQGGTFTISNLGMFGVKSFAAIINPPQSCILAVGAAESRLVPVEAKDGGQPYKTVKVMSVTMSCDHRVVDGAVGAQWLQAFKEYMEKPLSMLL